MDPLREFLEVVRRHSAARNNFRGLLHALIGRRITRADGTLVSAGMTWRAASLLLKQARWEKEAVALLGVEAGELPPRDRERFWYAAIARSGIDSAEAREAGDRFAAVCKKLGYDIGAAPSGT
jgi:hypothetical protein